MNHELSRRRFLEGVAAVAGVTLVGCSQSESGGQSSGAGLKATAAAGGGYELAGVGELGAGQGVVFNFPDGQPGVIFKTADGKLGAVSTVCPHAQCTVAWKGTGETPLVCPCHDSRFTTAGVVKGGPAKSNLSAFAVTLSGGNAVLKPV